MNLTRLYKKFFFSWLFFLFFSLHLAAEESNPPKFKTPRKIAILGDEMNLGRGADPDFDPRTDSLLKSLEGSVAKNQEDQSYPHLLWPSYKEFSDSLTWVLRQFSLSLARLAIDSPQLSWGARTALSFGLSWNDITISATPGGGVQSLKNQYDMVMEASSHGEMDTFLISLSGADLCALSPEQLMSPDRFYNHVLDFIDYVIYEHKKNGSTQGLQLVFLNYLGLTRIKSSDEIMKKEVFFKGEKKTYTCRDILESREKFLSSNLQDGQTSLELFSLGKIFPEDPKIFCPTFFARERFIEGSLSFSSNFDKELRAREIKIAKEDQMSHLAGLIRSYREKIEQAITLRRSDAEKAGVSLFFAKSTQDIQFEASDLASNCVDLSAEGHKKIFETLNFFLNQHQSDF